MFILERIIGVGIYSLLLFVFCLLIVGKSIKKIKLLLVIYSIIISILAFYFIPNSSADLYRIYGMIDKFKNYSFDGLLHKYVIDSTYGYPYVLYWGISQTGIPQLLPFFTSLLCYNCIFKNIAIALFFFMSLGSYIFVISNIRTMLGISLMCFCFFRESIEKKFRLFHIPLYVIAALIHQYCAVLLVIRLMIQFFAFKGNVVHKFLFLCFLGFFLFFIINNFPDYISGIIEKAEVYLTGESYSYFWDYFIAILTFLIFINVFVKSKKICKDKLIEGNAFRLYLLCGILLSLLFCYEFSIFHRTVIYILPIIATPFIMALLQKKDESLNYNNTQMSKIISNNKLNFNFVLILLSFIILLLSCMRGSLSSLKFFVL